GALARIDAELRRRQPDSHSFPDLTTIEEIPEGKRRRLGGGVHHWLRPVSVLADERKLRYRSGGPGRPPSPAPNVDQYLKRIAFYWESDSRLPGFHRVRPRR